MNCALRNFNHIHSLTVKGEKKKAFLHSRRKTEMPGSFQIGNGTFDNGTLIAGLVFAFLQEENKSITFPIRKC